MTDPADRALPTPYYDADGITIYHADCLDVLPHIEADVMVTDPPYGIGWRRGTNRRRGSRAHTGIAGDQDTTARDDALAWWGDRPAVVFGSFYATPPAEVKHVLVWHKPPDAGVVGSTTGYRRDVEPIYLVGPWPMRSVERSSLLRSNARQIGSPHSLAGRTGHPHAKPVDLMCALVEMCPPGTVLDPFMGAGSTLVAAKQFGRHAIGIEVDEGYCEVAAKRLAQGVLPLEVTG